MSTHNLCFEQKYENSQKVSTENCNFYSREKLLYVACALCRAFVVHLSLILIVRRCFELKISF